MAALTIVLRTRRKDDGGRAPVRLRIAHRGTKRFIGLDLKAEVEKWNADNERVRRSHPDAEEINAFRSELETTALPVLSELNRAGKMLTADRIKDAIQSASRVCSARWRKALPTISCVIPCDTRRT